MVARTIKIFAIWQREQAKTINILTLILLRFGMSQIPTVLSLFSHVENKVLLAVKENDSIAHSINLIGTGRESWF